MSSASGKNDYPLIPLFPLGLVLLPHMDLPLHIFEERYKIMIQECLEENRAFGIVFFNGEQIHNIGCSAEIQEITRRYEDGRMDIMTRGKDRFVVKELDESRPFTQARVLFFEDAAEEIEAGDAALVADVLRRVKELERISETRHNYDALTRQDMTRLSFLIPGMDGFTPQERQSFLETTSPRKRLIKCKTALSNVMQRKKLDLEIEKAVGGNGDVKALLNQGPFQGKYHT